MTLDKIFPAEGSASRLGFFRLAIALVQGGGLYYLFHAARQQIWPATDPFIFIPATLVFVFVPLIVISGLGHLRLGTLIAWKAVAFAILLGLGLQAADRLPAGWREEHGSFSLWVFSAALLFIAHALVMAGDADRRVIARYANYFDLAWKHIIQVALAGGFVGAFWLLFALANELFKLIGIRLLDELLERAWFVIPVSTLVAAFAIHITDVHAGIVRGLRNLGLTLLSWLLVMMTVLMVVFLLALPFTGLAPLWHQKSATSILLICAASLVVLINAAYQGGDREQPVSALMRVAGWAAALTLLPLVGLAAYALYLRIAPYGFTPDRVVATACILVAGAYAVGYALSLGHPKVWLGALERTNLAVSILIIAVLIALFTPIADPARISVADQMSRLAKGKIAADKFDYNFLRFEGARYGRDALKALAAKTDGPDAALIAEKAKAALAREYAYEPPKARSAQEIAASITVYPAGQVLPASFLGQDWATHSGYGLECLRGTEKCDGFFADFTGDGKPEIILIALGSHRAVVFENVADGSWPVLGSLENAYCAGTLEALRSGAFKLVTPRAKEIEIGGRRLHLNGGYEGCPDKTLSSPAQQSSAHDAR